MFGLAADVEAFRELGVPLIEDCAMSLGATFGGRKAGAMGEVAVCSFYVTKVIATGGEGGMVLTDKAELAQEVRGLRQYDGLLTAFWVIGITNAVNFLDGMDGLATGIGCIAAVFFGLVALQNSHDFMVYLSLPLVGSCLSFLPYNFRI